MIEGYYGIACGTVEVKEGDVLDLGGLTLAFLHDSDGALARDDGHVVRRGAYDLLRAMRSARSAH